MQFWEYGESGAAALLFALTFLFGGRLNPLRFLIRDRQTVVSFCAGMSAAYVFVHVMPELHTARESFVKSVSISLRYEGASIYFVSLVGFLAFYGLNQVDARLQGVGAAGQVGRAFWVGISGFAAYVCLMGYLLVQNLEENPVSIALYASAITVHFLALNDALLNEHGLAYDRIGRYILAGVSIFGWGLGLVFPLPHHVLALFVAFISGAIIVNSFIIELHSDRDGRYFPFVTGGVLYGLFLMPLS
jgi:hypothetical protein